CTHDAPTTQYTTHSLHDALPIWLSRPTRPRSVVRRARVGRRRVTAAAGCVRWSCRPTPADCRAVEAELPGRGADAGVPGHRLDDRAAGGSGSRRVRAVRAVPGAGGLPAPLLRDRPEDR